MPYAFSMGHTYLEIRGHQLCNILIKLRSSMALATVDSLIYGSQSSNFIFIFIPLEITALFECWKLSVYRWCRFTTYPNFSCLPFVLTIHAFLSFPQIPNPAENPHYNWYSHKFPNPTYSLNPFPKCLLCPPQITAMKKPISKLYNWNSFCSVYITMPGSFSTTLKTYMVELLEEWRSVGS